MPSLTLARVFSVSLTLLVLLAASDVCFADGHSKWQAPKGFSVKPEPKKADGLLAAASQYSAAEDSDDDSEDANSEDDDDSDDDATETAEKVPEKEVVVKQVPSNPAPNTGRSIPATGHTTPADKGGSQLVVSYVKPKDSSYNDLAKDLKDSKGMDLVVQAINETFNFPRINVVFDLCGEDNAFYQADNRQITLCYELVAALTEGFRKDTDLSDDEVGTQVMASLIFTFYHELGHASIDVFNLPITGNEEDAAERFATLLLLTDNAKDDEVDLADNAIGSFDMNTVESLEDLNFSDIHLVDDQRWYTMACLMVGSDPKKYDYLVGDDGLPQARADECPAEYAKVSAGWKTLMKPCLKKA